MLLKSYAYHSAFLHVLQLSFTVSEIPAASEYTGMVDMEEFWTSVSSEIISDGLRETFSEAQIT